MHNNKKSKIHYLAHITQIMLSNFIQIALFPANSRNKYLTTLSNTIIIYCSEKMKGAYIAC